jgi:hypothetical protein
MIRGGVAAAAADVKKGVKPRLVAANCRLSARLHGQTGDGFGQVDISTSADRIVISILIL